MLWRKVILSILSIFSKEKGSIPGIVISGKVTCEGVPAMNVVITMIDDNVGPFDHVLNFRTTNQKGKYTLNGTPNDSDLNVVLIVEHECHENRNMKNLEKTPSYSTYNIPIHLLENSNNSLIYDIELTKNNGVYSKTGQLLLEIPRFLKTLVTDQANVIKKAIS